VQEGGKSREKNMTIKEKEQKKNNKKRGQGGRKSRPSLPIAPPTMGYTPCTAKSCSPYGKLPNSNLCFCAYHQLNFTHGTHTLQCSYKGKLPG